MELLKEEKIKPITLTDLRWGLRGNMDLLDNLKCIKYYKNVKSIDKLKDKIEKSSIRENDKKKFNTFKDITKLKEAIEKYNKVQCIAEILKLKRDGLIDIYKKTLKYTDKQIEDLRDKAPKSSGGNDPIKIITGDKKAKKYTTKEQEEILKNKGVDDYLDPTDLKLTKRDKTDLVLTPAQSELIKKFNISNDKGLIAIWGLGTGKTTLATLATILFLQTYKDGKVVFIAPASLITNYVKTLYEYGIDIKNNRLEFHSYDSYLRKKPSCANGFMIIDESHNLRTPPAFTIEEKTKDNDMKISKETLKYTQGKRGGEIRRLCGNNARKILLLTGTPMVNTAFDLVNLMDIINQQPLDQKLSINDYYGMLNDPRQIKDYFSCKLSIFFNPKVDNKKDDPFPTKNEKLISVYFPNENWEKAHDILKTYVNMKVALREIEKLLGKKITDKLRLVLEPKNMSKDDKDDKEEVENEVENEIEEDTDDDDDDLSEAELKKKITNILTKKMKPKKTRKEDDEIVEGDGNPKAFMNGARRLVNILEMSDKNPKVKAIMDIITKTKDVGRNVIYTGFIDSGVKKLQEEIEKTNLSYALISGNVGMKQKQKAVDKYNNGELDILIITRSGAEGLDLKKTKNLFLLDGVWNEALASQIIGRGIRYKSHADLPLKKRVVNVYRVMVIKKSEETFVKALDKATKNPQDFEGLMMLIREKQAKDKDIMDGKEPKDEYVFITRKRRIDLKRRKDALRERFKNKEISKEQYLLDKENLSASRLWEKSTLNRYRNKERFIEEYFGKDRKVIDPSVDIAMYILSQSKQTAINDTFKVLQDKSFVHTIESSYCMSNNEREFKKEIDKLKTPSTKAQRIDIYNKIIGKQITNLNKGLEDYKTKVKTQAKALNQFYTDEDDIEFMVNMSDINSDKREIISILEPTAGDGGIIQYLFNEYPKKHRLQIRTTEIDPENRKLLKKILRDETDILYEEPDFLKLLTSDTFDYIFMNPPFTLTKKTNKDLKRTTYDLDFVLKAKDYLEMNGELVSLVYGDHLGKLNKGILGKLKTEIQNLDGNGYEVKMGNLGMRNFQDVGQKKAKKIPVWWVYIKKNGLIKEKDIDKVEDFTDEDIQKAFMKAQEEEEEEKPKPKKKKKLKIVKPKEEEKPKPKPKEKKDNPLRREVKLKIDKLAKEGKFSELNDMLVKKNTATNIVNYINKAIESQSVGIPEEF